MGNANDCKAPQTHIDSQSQQTDICDPVRRVKPLLSTSVHRVLDFEFSTIATGSLITALETGLLQPVTAANASD